MQCVQALVSFAIYQEKQNAQMYLVPHHTPIIELFHKNS